MKKFGWCFFALFVIVPHLFAEMNEPRRTFEGGFAVNSAGFGTNWKLLPGLVFPQGGVLMLDFTEMSRDLRNGLKLGGAADATLLFFNYNRGKLFRMGVSVNVTAGMGANLSQGMLDFLGGGGDGSVNASVGVYGSAFLDMSFSGMTFIENFAGRRGGDLGIKLTTSVFAPLFKIANGSSLEYTMNSQGISYRSNFTAYMQNVKSSNLIGDIMSGMGADFSLYAEYPVLPELDLALEVKHLPFVPGTLPCRIQSGQEVSISAASFQNSGLADLNSLLPDFGSMALESVRERVFRPVELGVSAAWRPYRWFALLGAFNVVFDGPVFVEYGLAAEFRANRFVSAGVSTNYEDRLFSQRLWLGLDFHAFAFTLSLQSVSPDFLPSFAFRGLGFGLGMKFGW